MIELYKTNITSPLSLSPVVEETFKLQKEQKHEKKTIQPKIKM